MRTFLFLLALILVTVAYCYSEQQRPVLQELRLVSPNGLNSIDIVANDNGMYIGFGVIDNNDKVSLKKTYRAMITVDKKHSSLILKNTDSSKSTVITETHYCNN